MVECCSERTGFWCSERFSFLDNNLSILSSIFDSDFGFDDRIGKIARDS